MNLILSKFDFDSRDIHFCLEFKNNLTLINGNSGVGKAYLFSLLKEQKLLHQEYPFRFLDLDIYLNDINPLIEMQKVSGKVFFIDDAGIILNNETRYFVSQDKRNQYVISTHSYAGFIPCANSHARLKVTPTIISLKYYV
jgi:hypothetical protein